MLKKDSRMTVDELIEILKGMPGSHKVVMSKDGEGNGFSPLAVAEESMYEAETTYGGEIYLTDYQIEHDPMATEEDRAPEDAIPVVVLWPVN